MSNPATLFRLARENAIVVHCLKIWESGNLNFQSVLFMMISALDRECSHLIDEYKLNENSSNLRDLIKQIAPSEYLPPVSATNALADEDILVRQSKLIRDIEQLCYLHGGILSTIMRIQSMRSPQPIIISGQDKMFDNLKSQLQGID